jgi:hypothetical protein
MMQLLMEYAGAVEVDPPFRAGELACVRGAGWTPSRDGQSIRPRPDLDLETCLRGLRELISLDRDERAYAGVVAAYDPVSRELTTVTVRDGRATRRGLRRPTLRARSNVIDLATRRRSISRSLSTPTA